eukprot:6643913-Pyramimonas_sp.AAC.1
MSEGNSQLLSAIFGPTKFDEPVFADGRVSERANPWARPAQQDVDALAAAESGASLHEYQSPFGFLFKDCH